MLENIIKSLFGDPSTKKVNNLTKIVENIKQKEEEFKDFSENDIKKKTLEFRKMFEWLDFTNLEDSQKIKEILDEIKSPAFALVKTATKLLNGKKFKLESGKEIEWNMIPYDVQLVWWLAIHEWNIAEMKTWEWKTLVATMPAYLNALTWNTVHIVTVNDYLASRDAEEMWILYNMLGLSVWVVTHEQTKDQKQESYKKDIVYATNNELGFDYLRDNMVVKKEDKTQSKIFFAIIDEVDSILIDEARTPLIISQPDNEPTTKYVKFATLSKSLENKKHYKIDEKQKTATLTEDWIKKVEELLKVDNIYVSNHYNDLHHIENALKAIAVYIKDKDYLVRDWEVLIIDEHTWRVLPGRRYSDWLHQALEAKEKVDIKQESKTLASITFQNYFRMYWKLSWMTWTAKTEEEEFYKVYSLDTLVIPTNKPIIRDDRKDLLFKNEKGKFDYVVELIKEIHETWQPILVWTVSVDKSEYLSNRLRKEGVKHSVLNAKHNESEAEIVSKAWEKWAVTIATNMAWRGTDIKLWNWVVKTGWLFIIWTEKHETRRIDNQLRGRSWRQWDPWVTQFLISPNDDIMRIFGWDKLFGVFNSPMFAALPDNEPLAQSSMLTRKVTSVQKQVEGHNFDIRKHILEYDDVINKHREIIYSRRDKILNSENIDEEVHEMVKNQTEGLVEAEVLRMWDDFDKSELTKKVNDFIGHEIIDNKIESDDISAIKDSNELARYISNISISELDNLKYQAKVEEDFYELERRIVLQSIDELWMRHINAMSRLREDVAFEGYAQRNPLVTYKEKAFTKFNDLIDEIEFKVIKAIFSVNKVWEVESFSMDSPEIEVNTDDLENMLKGFDEANKKEENSNTNPLFVNPKSSPKNDNKKVRIRV